MARAASMAASAQRVAPQVKRGLLGMIGMSLAVALYFVMAMPAAVLIHLVGHHIVRSWRRRGIALTGGLLAMLILAFAVPSEIGLNLYEQRLADQREEREAQQLKALLHLAAEIRAARTGTDDLEL